MSSSSQESLPRAREAVLDPLEVELEGKEAVVADQLLLSRSISQHVASKFLCDKIL